MKKVILAIDNKKIIDKIKEVNNLKVILKKVQYREAILEILKKEKNINFIFINEKLSGQISIENLINKIKMINKEINIIFFLEKEDIKKENKLKKMGIKNIYITNKIKFNEILNLLEENNLEINKKINMNFEEEKNKKENISLKNKILKINNNKKNKYNKINKKDNTKKIITIYGESKSGKSTIINLLIIYLMEKNKKILLINLNNKIEKIYLILLKKKYLKNKDRKYNNKFEKNNIKNSEIKINKNLTLVHNFQNNIKNKKMKTKADIEKAVEIFIKQHIKSFDYILVDVGSTKNKILTKEIINKSDKKIIVWNRNFLGVKEIKELIRKNKKDNNKFDKSLHIIQNKYYFYSISYLITKSIFGKLSNVHKILYRKKYMNLNQKILKNEKVKIKKSIKNQIEKILN